MKMKMKFIGYSQFANCEFGIKNRINTEDVLILDCDKNTTLDDILNLKIKAVKENKTLLINNLSCI